MARPKPTIRPQIAVRWFILLAVALFVSAGLAQAQVAPDPATDTLRGILGDGEGLSGTVIQLFLFVTVLSLAPCFLPFSLWSRFSWRRGRPVYRHTSTAP